MAAATLAPPLDGDLRLVRTADLEGRALASVGLAHLDRAALDLVRRAAPFPAPPRAVQRRFSVHIKGQ
jgi:protein TonB